MNFPSMGLLIIGCLMSDEDQTFIHKEILYEVFSMKYNGIEMKMKAGVQAYTRFRS
jgi:hypothetical protein